MGVKVVNFSSLKANKLKTNIKLVLLYLKFSQHERSLQLLFFFMLIVKPEVYVKIWPCSIS